MFQMNVINFKRLCIILLSVVIISCLSSCQDKDVAYSKVTFFYACSPDLLEIGTPVFAVGNIDNIKDNNNDLIQPTADEFHPTGKKFPITLSTSTFGGDSIETEEVFYTYPISQRFDDVTGKYLLASVLSLKEGISEEDFPDKDYLLYNNFSQVKIDLYNKKDELISTTTANIPMTGSKQESGLGALFYLSQETDLKLLLYSWEYDKDKHNFNSKISRGAIKIDSLKSEIQAPVNVKSLPDMIRSNGNNSVEKMKEYLERHKADIIDNERGNVNREQITIPIW